MQTSSNTCPRGCRGECLHDIEFIPYQDKCDAGFCDFVCQFMGKDSKPQVMRKDPTCKVVWTDQPCANFELCGSVVPQWELNLHGGICTQPCALVYGCAFEFSKFAADEACPVCLEAGLSSVVFQCQHMVCARCYGQFAFNEAAAEALKRCAICRVECKPRIREMVDTSFFY
jgi:hypothetical protein